MHNHSHHHHNHSSKNILLAFVLNLFFAVIELIGGYFTNSVAIMSDALHDFGDSLSLGFSFVCEKLSHKHRDKNFNYGYKRLSVLGALVNVIVLSIGSVLVVINSVQKLISPHEVSSHGMIWLAVLGIVINGVSAFGMRDSHKILDKTVVMHLMEDLLGWVAVLVVSVVIYFTNWYILDPILSLIICIIIGKGVISNAITVVKILMQAVPDNDLYDELAEHISEHPNVAKVLDFKLWTLDGEEHVASIIIKASEQTQVVASEIREIFDNHHIHDVTIEVR